MENKNIIIELKTNETVSFVRTMIDDLKDTFNTLLQSFQLSNMFEDVIPDNDSLNDQLFENCIGYILEEYIKLHLKNISSPEFVKHFKFNNDRWYDFKYDNTQIKLLTFKKDSLYSTTSLTNLQYEHRKEMIFISIVYAISGNSLTIDEILITNGKNVKVNNDKVLYSSVIIPPVTTDPEVENDENLTALRLVFTSNLQGGVQILDL